jgi:hypothetical protein
VSRGLFRPRPPLPPKCVVDHKAGRRRHRWLTRLAHGRSESVEGVERGFGDPLTLQILRQEGDVVVESIQALVLDGGDPLEDLGRIYLRFCRLGRSHLRSRLVHESYRGGIHTEAMEHGTGSVESQRQRQPWAERLRFDVA